MKAESPFPNQPKPSSEKQETGMVHEKSSPLPNIIEETMLHILFVVRNHLSAKS